MNQQDRLDYLINYLIKENNEYRQVILPNTEEEKKNILRSLLNIRMPKPISDEFINIQDLYLQEEMKKQDIVSLNDLVPIRDRIYLWQGDITKLKVDAIVNAANSALLGCFIPCHKCIDNAIHSAAGVQLRLECKKIMDLQQNEEPTGMAKITKGYNLPAKYVIHTVGPIINGKLTRKQCELLSSCYKSSLELADLYGLKSIAFCCISTGEFHFPNDIAGEIAVNTVLQYFKETNTEIEVIFNVFKEKDREIYRKLLG